MQSTRQAGICFPVLTVLRLLFACLTILPLCLLSCSPVNASQVSLYRAFYQDIDAISTVELHERLFTVTLIDVRSRFEFDAVHISRSLSLPLANCEFLSGLEKPAVLGENVAVVLVATTVTVHGPSKQRGSLVRSVPGMFMSTMQEFIRGCTPIRKEPG